MRIRKISLKDWLRSEKNQELVRKCGLAGCPVGGWPQTAQAIRRIQDEIPHSEQRTFSVYSVINALYRVENDRYVLREDA